MEEGICMVRRGTRLASKGRSIWRGIGSLGIFRRDVLGWSEREREREREMYEGAGS
jgi:hypothetical protein